MNNSPFFTIGIPVYNTQELVSRCLDSILCQNFDNFEIICVDDGSTDNSLSVLNSYATKDNRINVISRPNGGPATARNCMIYNASGQYIYFIDSDDTMCKDALSVAFERLTANAMPDVMETGYSVIAPDHTDRYNAVYPGDEYFLPDLTKDERAVKLWLNTTYSVCVFAKFFKREFIISNGITFNARYMIGEDNAFIFDVHRKADSIVFENFSPCEHYVERQGSLITQKKLKPLYTGLCYESELFEDLRFYNLSGKFREQNKDLIQFKINEFATTKRDYIFTLLQGPAKKDTVLETAEIIEKFIGKYLKYLPSEKGFTGIVFTMYRLIGIKLTVSLLYDYLKLKGVIYDEK